LHSPRVGADFTSARQYCIAETTAAEIVLVAGVGAHCVRPLLICDISVICVISGSDNIIRVISGSENLGAQSVASVRPPLRVAAPPADRFFISPFEKGDEGGFPLLPAIHI